MDTLLELAERCEQATGPDRELDLAIGNVLGVDTYYLKHWSASLDAAMSLVPEGWVESYSRRSDNTTAAGCYKSGGGAHETALAATPALALCAAALRARAANPRRKEG